jgi:glycosyltransferase involved in cell wall biosynthesis
MNITVIVPILNEEKSIDALIEALMNQTLSPSEVVLVDGGSQDSTIEKVKSWQQKQTPFLLTLIEQQGANRSKSRNIGIEQSKTEVIALTDAGCEPKYDWLELLVQPFVQDKKTQVVAGFYDTAPRGWWEDMMADYTSVREWNFDRNSFLPSSRSLAITKKMWEKVGKYPEELDTCEDLVFANRLKEEAKHWHVVKDAQVVWQQPKTLSELSHKIHGYALGDLDAKYQPHVKKIYSAMWRIIVLIGLAVPAALLGQQIVRIVGLALILLYILGSIGKHLRMLKYPLAIFVLPIMQITVDFALVQAIVYHKISSQYR